MSISPTWQHSGLLLLLVLHLGSPSPRIALHPQPSGGVLLTATASIAPHDARQLFQEALELAGGSSATLAASIRITTGRMNERGQGEAGAELREAPGLKVRCCMLMTSFLFAVCFPISSALASSLPLRHSLYLSLPLFLFLCLSFSPSIPLFISITLSFLSILSLLSHNFATGARVQLRRHLACTCLQPRALSPVMRISLFSEHHTRDCAVSIRRTRQHA